MALSLFKLAVARIAVRIDADSVLPKQVSAHGEKRRRSLFRQQAVSPLRLRLRLGSQGSFVTTL